MYSWVIRVAVLFLLLSIGIGNKLPNDIRCVVKSKEYKNLTEQVYSSAWDKVSKKIKRRITNCRVNRYGYYRFRKWWSSPT